MFLRHTWTFSPMEAAILEDHGFTLEYDAPCRYRLVGTQNDLDRAYDVLRECLREESP